MKGLTKILLILLFLLSLMVYELTRSLWEQLNVLITLFLFLIGVSILDNLDKEKKVKTNK